MFALEAGVDAGGGGSRSSGLHTYMGTYICTRDVVQVLAGPLLVVFECGSEEQQAQCLVQNVLAEDQRRQPPLPLLLLRGGRVGAAAVTAVAAPPFCCVRVAVAVMGGLHDVPERRHAV